MGCAVHYDGCRAGICNATCLPVHRQMAVCKRQLRGSSTYLDYDFSYDGECRFFHHQRGYKTAKGLCNQFCGDVACHAIFYGGTRCFVPTTRLCSLHIGRRCQTIRCRPHLARHRALHRNGVCVEPLGQWEC